DADTVETELMLSDLESLERRLDATTKKAKGGDKEARATLAVVEAALGDLRAGRPARRLSLSEAERPIFRQLQLLTAKPVLYICNVEESAAAHGNNWSARVGERAAREEAAMVVISAAIEAEVAQLANVEEKREFLAHLGLEEPGLARVIRAGYRLL